MADPLSPAWHLRKICFDAGIFTGPWIAYVGDLPADPDTAIMFKDTGGRSGEVNVAIDYPSVQVLVRGKSGSDSYSQAYDMARAIQQVLHAIPNAPQYPALDSITMVGHINHVGKSERDRHVFSINFRLIVSYESDGYREALNP